MSVCGDGGADCVTMVVLTTGVEVVVVESGLVTTTAGVEVVVVVTTVLGGADGGGAETTCESGSEAQPARSPRALQQARMGVNCLTARAEAERDRRLRTGFNMAPDYT
jgi:hypothetical protein